MYPFARMGLQVLKYRNAPALGPFETHVSTHLCWPWDLDFWGELNNGRTLTLYDLGRILLAYRTGLIAVMRRERWGLTVAGSSVRYRKRVRLFDRMEMHSRLLGWDARFLYLDQSLWRDETCCSQVLIRAAITDAGGIVVTERLAAALDRPVASPPLPDWVSAWIAAEAKRPWPPEAEMRDAA